MKKLKEKSKYQRISEAQEEHFSIPGLCILKAPKMAACLSQLSEECAHRYMHSREDGPLHRRPELLLF